MRSRLKISNWLPSGLFSTPVGISRRAGIAGWSWIATVGGRVAVLLLRMGRPEPALAAALSPCALLALEDPTRPLRHLFGGP